MSVQESANRLISIGNEYVQNVAGLGNAAGDRMRSAADVEANIHRITTETLVVCTQLMGNDHPAMMSLVQSCSAVNRKAEELQEVLELAQAKQNELDQLAIINGETMAMIGRQLLQGGR